MDIVQKYLLPQSYIKIDMLRVRVDSKREKYNNHQTEIEKYEFFEKDDSTYEITFERRMRCAAGVK